MTLPDDWTPPRAEPARPLPARPRPESFLERHWLLACCGVLGALAVLGAAIAGCLT